jgi:hydroxymethylglutaryl-CoA reductase
VLSNQTLERRVYAQFKTPYAYLASDAIDQKSEEEGKLIAEHIVNVYRFAMRDVNRAVTHNKGVMNGIDAVAISTGNDFRAIESAAHAFASRRGRYLPLTRFYIEATSKSLVGEIELPMAVGVVGGIMSVHPGVKAAHALLGSFAKSAKQLAMLMGVVGLAQNLGALRALATHGIQAGHMKLHKRKFGL